MDKKTILLYGSAGTGKSTFVRKINGVEKNVENNDLGKNLKSYPTIYVINEKPIDISPFDIVIEFKKDQAIFEKGFSVQ
jgi:energy-coupling factor transporter ATP-binding protein EcfA2